MELKTYFAQDEFGNVLPDATCYLYQRGTENLIAGLLKPNGEGLTNPFKAGADGKTQFAVANGIYDLRVVSGARDYRVSVQSNDVTADVAAAAASANRAEAARDAAQLSSGIYPTIEKGLLATGLDKYFSVPSADAKEYLILYRNSGGVAVESKRYPSVELVNDIGRRTLSSINVAASRIPVAATDFGQVAIWLENGLLAALGLSSELKETVIKDFITRASANPNMIPLMATAFGQVVTWLENGRFNAAGLAYTIRDVFQEVVRSGNYSPNMLPLVFTEAGQVPLWMENGRFNATGLDSKISEAVQRALTAIQPKIKVTDGSSLYSYRAKIAAALGGAGTARVVMTGDSWTEHLAETAQPLSQALYAAFGQAGNGWFGVRADVSNPVAQLLNGAVLSKTGTWTLYDLAEGVSDALDGHAISATGTTETITVANLKTQGFDWYYKDGDGTFRYTIDGGTPVVVAGGNTGLRTKVSVTGLADTVHTIVFDLVGNTGTVMMYGGLATRTTPGVELSKAGNGGSTAPEWQRCAPFVQKYAAELLPDLAIIILGTNDRNAGIAKAAFKAGVQALVNAYRTGSPNCSVILITPTLSGTLTDLGLIGDYADAMREIAASTPLVEFIDLNSFMPPRTTLLSYGMWSDTVHLSEIGGRYVTGLLMKYFLKTI